MENTSIKNETMLQKEATKWLPYVEGKFGKQAYKLTKEKMMELVDSPKVRQLMEGIEATEDQEQKNRLKEQLPAVQYHCLWNEDGLRPKNDTAVASGLCMHDWDHVEGDPRTLYLNRVAGREAELGIVLAHVTPRGEGLRLVTRLHEGEWIVDCQKRLARELNAEKYADVHVKDLARLSFLPSREYIIYMDEEGLWKGLGEASQLAGKTSENGGCSGSSSSSEASKLPKPAENFGYKGLMYSTIIEALMKRIATAGEVKEGERNQDLYLLTRELRHICDYNFETLYLLVAPYFPGLPDSEVRRTISSALGTNGRTMTPLLKGILDQLTKERDGEGGEELTLEKLPRLSDVEEMILEHFPKHLRSQVYLASLPIWGVYGTGVRFNYLDGRENSLSFMTSVVGKSGSGKSFANHLFVMMTRRLREADALERQKADEYLEACNRAADSSEKPEDPRPKVRIYGDDITTSQFLEYLANLNGMHGLQYTEEVARLCKAKRTLYGDNDDLYCKAFDNAVGGKESKSKLTRNIRIPIFLNTLFCGTPGAMHKFYNNPEGGLNNRIIYAFMPTKRPKGFPRYEPFTEAEQAQFDQVCEQLAAIDQKLVLPWLDSVIMKVKAKWEKEDDENPNDVWYDLGKRSMVIAYRAGVLQWLLRGCPQDDKSLKAISKVVRWVAETVRASVYYFCGKEYEEINETNNAMQLKQSLMTKNKKLYSLLPVKFVVQDVVNLRVQNGDSANVYMVIKRWVDDGLVIRTSPGCYEKVKQIA